MLTERTLQITGMHCGNCAQRLSLALRRNGGVAQAEVDVAGEASIRFDDAKVDSGNWPTWFEHPGSTSRDG